MVILDTVNRSDPFAARIAIASALEKMAPQIGQESVSSLFDFFISKEALGDRHSEVRRTMLNAAIAVVDLHGAEAVSSLMKMFEEYLGRTGPSSDTDDYTKEAVVIVSPDQPAQRCLLI
jgi:hypothetical protein